MPGPTVDTEPNTRIAGWYGKIPALGDFASRRLPPNFVNSWDNWLQGSMLASRSALRERWQELYLNSPIWRFTLLPGVLDEKCWVGIMMPSADRVGRYFPLTIALSIEAHPEVLSTLFAAQNWFAALEQIALASLSIDFQVTDLEGLLAKNPWESRLTRKQVSEQARELSNWWAETAVAPIVLTLPDIESIPPVLEASGIDLMAASGSGKCLWWTCDEVAGTTEFRGFTGLPPDENFADLLMGVASGPMSL